MKSLPPIVSGVDGKHLKLQALEEMDFDFVGYLLSCHLVIEHHLDEFLLTLGPSLRWEAAKLTFSQKLALFPPAIFPRGTETVVALRHLNSLRNKLAHKITTRPADLDFHVLRTFLVTVSEGSREVPTEPTPILEQFTGVICSMLIGWVASDAYRTSWRNTRKA